MPRRFPSRNTICLFFACLSIIFSVQPVLADGSVVSKIYHPYVQALEKEIEFRSIYERDNDRYDQQTYQLAYGQSVSDTWFGEFYLIGSKDGDNAFEIEAYEAELKWQMTEQGEYSADWGLLFELEKEEGGGWEAANSVLVERELGRVVGTANLSLIYEWGDSIEDELESKLALQVRYRQSPRFEPAIELFAGQDYKGIGPSIMGQEILGLGKRLHWELATIFAIDNDSPHLTVKSSLEYEF